MDRKWKSGKFSLSLSLTAPQRQKMTTPSLSLSSASPACSSSSQAWKTGRLEFLSKIDAREGPKELRDLRRTQDETKLELFGPGTILHRFTREIWLTTPSHWSALINYPIKSAGDQTRLRRERRSMAALGVRRERGAAEHHCSSCSSPCSAPIPRFENSFHSIKGSQVRSGGPGYRDRTGVLI